MSVPMNNTMRENKLCTKETHSLKWTAKQLERMRTTIKRNIHNETQFERSLKKNNDWYENMWLFLSIEYYQRVCGCVFRKLVSFLLSHARSVCVFFNLTSWLSVHSQLSSPTIQICVVCTESAQTVLYTITTVLNNLIVNRFKIHKDLQKRFSNNSRKRHSFIVQLLFSSRSSIRITHSFSYQWIGK